MRSRAGGDDGSATVIVVAVIAVTVLFGLGAADLASVLIADARVQTAADSAALAAAQELAMPSGLDPEGVASEYAARNGAVLTGCRCDAGTFEAVVEVRLEVRSLLLFGSGRLVSASARAIVNLPPG